MSLNYFKLAEFGAYAMVRFSLLRGITSSPIISRLERTLNFRQSENFNRQKNKIFFPTKVDLFEDTKTITAELYKKI